VEEKDILAEQAHPFINWQRITKGENQTKPWLTRHGSGADSSALFAR